MTPAPYATVLFFLLASIVASSESATQPSTQPVRQASDGSILLHARDVTIHGTTVRFEPDPHKNTVGFWTRKEDWVSWTFDVAEPGKFQVIILQGCGKGSGGSEVQLAVAGQELQFTVRDTGGFQNFVERDIGSVDLTKGLQTVEVRPLTKPGVAVMDLRQILLKPLK